MANLIDENDRVCLIELAILKISKFEDNSELMKLAKDINIIEISETPAFYNANCDAIKDAIQTFKKFLQNESNNDEIKNQNKVSAIAYTQHYICKLENSKLLDCALNLDVASLYKDHSYIQDLIHEIQNINYYNPPTLVNDADEITAFMSFKNKLDDKIKSQANKKHNIPKTPIQTIPAPAIIPVQRQPIKIPFTKESYRIETNDMLSIGKRESKFDIDDVYENMNSEYLLHKYLRETLPRNTYICIQCGRKFKYAGKNKSMHCEFCNK